MPNKFTWYEVKRAANLAKHKLNFIDADLVIIKESLSAALPLCITVAQALVMLLLVQAVPQ